MTVCMLRINHKPMEIVLATRHHFKQFTALIESNTQKQSYSTRCRASTARTRQLDDIIHHRILHLY